MSRLSGRTSGEALLPCSLRVVVAASLALTVVMLQPAAADPGRKAAGLDLLAARRIVVAAETEAHKGKPSSIVVVDRTGAVLAAERMDGAFPASAKVAQGKAETAAAFWQSTADLENATNGVRPALVSSGYTLMQGGVPLTVDGEVVGAVGVSGGSKDQDEAVARAGVAEFVR